VRWVGGWGFVGGGVRGVVVGNPSTSRGSVARSLKDLAGLPFSVEGDKRKQNNPFFLWVSI